MKDTKRRAESVWLDERIEHHAKAGDTPEQIAKRLGISKWSVKNRMRKLGLKWVRA